MIKRTLTTLFVAIAASLMFCGYVSAQAVQIDKRLEKGYDAEYLKRIQAKTPIILELLNFELDHSWYIEAPEMQQKINDIPYLYYKDPETGERAGMVESIEIGNVNITEFYVERPYDHRAFYRVGKTNTIIGFYSNKEVSEMFNASKGISNE